MIKRAVSRERKERKKEKKRREKKDSKSGDIIRSMYYSLSSFKVNRDRWAMMSAKKTDKKMDNVRKEETLGEPWRRSSNC